MNDHHHPKGWEPDPNKMGNWREMFEPNRRPGGGGGTAPPPHNQPQGHPPNGASGPEREPDEAEAGPHIDPAQYRPWQLQRGRSRPAMMLDLRRFEERSGLWVGWQVSYPHLIAVEYIGDKMLSLDFGVRQFMVEGEGLSELARHLQAGTVLALHEYAASVWPNGHAGPWIRSIRRLGLPEGGPQAGR